jgi:hypothetical protein
LGRSLKNGRWWKWRLFQCQWCKIYEVQMILCSLIGHRRQWWQSKIYVLYSDPCERIEDPMEFPFVVVFVSACKKYLSLRRNRPSGVIKTFGCHLLTLR